MTIAAWCVLAAAIMPVLLAGVAKAGSPYDNSRPRELEGRLDGYRKRAYAAASAHEARAVRLASRQAHGSSSARLRLFTLPLTICSSTSVSQA